MQWTIGMLPLVENLRLLEAAQGYAALGLYLQSNQELERMSPDTRHWPEVLDVKLAIFDGLKLWEMAEIVTMQLAETSQRETRAARRPKRPGVTETATPRVLFR